ncbi:hypothetical protein [Streptomyces sp. NPDC046887]|uniref:hypothetical protein n=1 Tax=Streptomyces sp. NPDC046887 TaxID=3155472 RepID=UPI00340287F9
MDRLLTEFEGGAAGKTRVADPGVTRDSLGTGMCFAEADGFYTQYNRVHQSLLTLSKSLNDQIELYRLGVHAADVGYDDVDDDTRRSFHAIYTKLDKAWDKAQGGASAPEREQRDAPNVTKDMG